MRARLVGQRGQRGELLGQALGLGEELVAQHIGLGHAHVAGDRGLGGAHLGFAARLGQQAFFQHLGIGQALLFVGVGRGLDDARLGQALFLMALGFGHQLLGNHAGLGQAFLFQGGGGDFAHLGIGQAGRGALDLDGLGQLLLGLGGLAGRFQLGLGHGRDFHGLVARGSLFGLGLLDLAHHVFLGLGLGGQHGDLLHALGLGDHAHFLDAFLFLGHGLFHHHALAHHVGDVGLLDLDGLFLLDALQLHLALAGHDLQLLGARDLLDLDHHGTLTVLLGHGHFALAVFLTDVQLLLGLDARLLGLQALFLLHLLGFGLLARLDGGDLALLARLGIGLLALQRQHGFLGLHVLLGDGQVGVALELVGDDVLVGRQLGDLADALGIQDVVGVQRGLGRLLQVVDGHVFQHIAVEVVADDMDDLVAEILAVLEQLDELDLLAHGLERLGELGVEQLVDGRLVRGPVHADGLGHLEHVLGRFIDAQVEGHGDVGAHVVAADQAFLAAPVDLQRQQRDLHELLLVDHRQHQAARELDLGLRRGVVDDQRRALRNLDVEGLDQGEQPEDDDEDGTDHHPGDDVPLHVAHVHANLPCELLSVKTLKKRKGRARRTDTRALWESRN